MVHFDPAAIEAAGTVILAAETGVAMAFSSKKTASTPAGPTVVVNGITGAEYLLGMFLLALAMLGAAVIIHHGLVA
jgi:hypothetical protein